MFKQFAWSERKMKRLRQTRDDEETGGGAKLTEQLKKNTNAVDEPNQILSSEINEAIKASSSHSLLNQDWSAEHTKYRSAAQPEFTALDIICSVGD